MIRLENGLEGNKIVYFHCGWVWGLVWIDDD